MPKSPAPTPAPAQNAQTTNNNKDLGISVPDSQTLSSDTKNSKKYTVSIIVYYVSVNCLDSIFVAVCCVYTIYSRHGIYMYKYCTSF